jgi:hypothetical protein
MKNKLEISVKQPSDSDEEDFDLFTVWKEYEAIAMHFNDLILKIRTQSLAAVAAFATIAGVLLKGESISHELRWGTLTAVFIALCVFWLAIWIIDFTYYNRLLLGAVRALTKIEEESKTSTRTSSIYLTRTSSRPLLSALPQERRTYDSQKAVGCSTYSSSLYFLASCSHQCASSTRPKRALLPEH